MKREHRAVEATLGLMFEVQVSPEIGKQIEVKNPKILGIDWGSVSKMV